MLSASQIRNLSHCYLLDLKHTYFEFLASLEGVNSSPKPKGGDSQM